MQNEIDETRWKIGYQDDDHEKEIKDKANSTAELAKRWKDFERDVTINPYYHHKKGRIEKLKDTAYKGNYRYRNEPIRVVYYPEGATKTVYPLNVGSSTDIKYKKRSFK
jgi:mRNA-degrading endonuclease RelE of RelBE toxin-antitoxin system